MQFGVFTIEDVAPDLRSEQTLREHEPIGAMDTTRTLSEEVGPIVLATGEQHQSRLGSSAPTAMLDDLVAYATAESVVAVIALPKVRP